MLENKIVVVTGATGGLGKVVTKMLLERGAKVVALYRNEEKFSDLKQQVDTYATNLFGIKGDATNEAECRALISKTVELYGRVDVLLNIVGGYTGGLTVSETPESDLDNMVTLNIKSAFLCSKAAITYMINQNYGKIVNISAKASSESGRKGKSAAYAISKAGVRILTEALAEEVTKYNININCVMPSTIDTEENRRLYPKSDYSKWVPVDQIAETILFLSSDASKPINGAAIPVYGKA